MAAASVPVVVDEEASQRDISENCGEWVKNLSCMPSFTQFHIDSKLIGGGETSGPNAHRNKTQGYRLWKDGYVCQVFVKPNIKAKSKMFAVKAKAQASMKNGMYDVYVHLCQESGDVLYANCCCKAGQCGCCKHVAAVLFTILDYCNIGADEVPDDLTCTQTAQKWHVPAQGSTALPMAVKFTDLQFEKADLSKNRKREAVMGERDYCATPPYAYNVQKEELQELAGNLQAIGSATLFCKSVLSNDYEPCTMFETSTSKRVKKMQTQLMNNDEEDAIAMIFSAMDTSDAALFCEDEVIQDCAPSINIWEAIDICVRTAKQSSCNEWFAERSKRVTASLFGKIMKRKKSVYPTSLVSSIVEKKKSFTSIPMSLKWGIDNEVIALEAYKTAKKLDVLTCGLVINPKWPWLGASPDGVIIQNEKPIGCLEIKCPFSKKDCTVADAVHNDKRFFMGVDDKGVIGLKRNHEYYFQCQGVANILEVAWVDFVVYTNKELYVERIYKDQNLWERKMLKELKNFYVEFVLPKLV